MHVVIPGWSLVCCLVASFSLAWLLFTSHIICKLLLYQGNDQRICITFQRALLSAPQWKMKPYLYWLGQIGTEWKG